MGFTNTGFSSTADGYVSENEWYQYAEWGEKPLYLTFKTESGADTHKTFDIAIRFRGVPRGIPSTLVDWSDWYKASLPVADCQPHKNPNQSGWYWAVGLDKFGNLPKDMLGKAGSTINYLNRTYDYVEVQVSYVSHYVDGLWWTNGKTQSDAEYANAGIVYVPDYKFKTAYYDEADLIVIEYEAEGWERADDRFAVESISHTSIMSPEEPNLVIGNVYGTVADFGRIEIKTSSLSEGILNTKTNFYIRFNAAYRPIETKFTTMRDSVLVQSKVERNTPTIQQVSASKGTYIEFAVGDSGDKDSAIDKVVMKMNEGEYTLDEVTVNADDSGAFPHAVFKFAPFNKKLSFTAIGSRGKGVSQPVSVSVPPIKSGNATVFDSITDDNQIELDANVDISIAVKPDVEMRKFAGRTKPSAFYGIGCEREISFSADLINDSAERLLSLPYSGSVMVRMPDGKRYAVAPTDVKTSWQYRPIKSVQIKGTEVEA